jgi:hypothetical protein
MVSWCRRRKGPLPFRITTSPASCQTAAAKCKAGAVLAPVFLALTGMVVLACSKEVSWSINLPLLRRQCEIDPRLVSLLPPKESIVAALEDIRDSSDRVAENQSMRAAFWPPLFRCSPLKVHGGDETNPDGGKWVCGLEGLQAPCTIYSLGSRLDFSFEAAAVNATPCSIVTADCTVSAAAARQLLPQRTVFYPVCLGASDRVDRWSHETTMLPTLMARVGHSKIDVLKVRGQYERTGVQRGRETVTLPTLMARAGHSKIDVLKVRGGQDVCTGGQRDCTCHPSSLIRWTSRVPSSRSSSASLSSPLAVGPQTCPHRSASKLTPGQTGSTWCSCRAPSLGWATSL